MPWCWMKKEGIWMNLIMLAKITTQMSQNACQDGALQPRCLRMLACQDGALLPRCLRMWHYYPDVSECLPGWGITTQMSQNDAWQDVVLLTRCLRMLARMGYYYPDVSELWYKTLQKGWLLLRSFTVVHDRMWQFVIYCISSWYIAPVHDR